MSDPSQGKKGVFYWIMFVLIFIGAFLVLRFVFKIFFSVVYFAIIAGVAFIAAAFVLKKVFGKPKE